MSSLSNVGARDHSVKRRRPKPHLDLIGQKFGRLEVISHAERPGIKGVWWVCQCSCDSTVTVLGDRLKSGATKSCGCYRREATRARMLTHGATASGSIDPEFHAWTNMRERCSNPRHQLYRWYGARGITVEPAWDRPGTGYQAFLDHVGRRPSPELSLERIDNSRGYIIGNVTWRTRHAQNRNRRSSHWIEAFGLRKILSDWARDLNISPAKLSAALRDYDDMLFIVMWLRPSYLGMLNAIERQKLLDRQEQERRQRAEADGLKVVAI